MKAFFRKYLNNNCTSEDLDAVVDLFFDPEKQDDLDLQMEEDWNQGSRLVDVPELSGTLHKIHFEINKTERGFTKTRKLINNLSRIAAILFVPLALAFLYYLYNQNEAISQTISTPLASKTTFVLPDGSTVWLNAGSSIKFPQTFSGNARTVVLTGEAFFDVKRSKHPFLVKTSSFTVKVLGTAFDVMAYHNEMPTVTLERGKVMLTTRSDKDVFLKPGQQAIVDTLRQTISLENVDTKLYSAWIHHQLIFKNEPLNNVVKRLERWYNIQIDINDPSLLNKRMTASIEFESVREVMELMKLALPISYKYDKDLRKLVISRSKN